MKKKLGFGLMRLPLTNENLSEVDLSQSIEMIDYYMQKGYNYFDTAYSYLKGNSEKTVRKALTERYPRDSFVLTSKMPIFNLKNEEDMERIFNEQLKRCGVDYFDYYLLHNVSSKHLEKFTKIDSFEFVKQKQREGKIRHIGISCHDNPEFLESILIKHPEVEVVQLQINYLDWNDKIINSCESYEIAKKYNKEIIIMEPLKGGSLTNLPKEALELINKKTDNSPLSLAFHFCLELDNIKVILSGMNSIDEVKENISVFNSFNSLNSKEKSLLVEVSEIINKHVKIKCTSCNYCLENCPQEINIPYFFRLYNSQKLLENAHSLSMYYNNFVSKNKRPSDCVECNNCLDICPQQIDIPLMLKLVSEEYEKK